MTHESHLVPCFAVHTAGSTEILHRLEMDEEDVMFPRLQELFGWDDLPTIDIDGLGATGYLDFVKRKHVPEKVLVCKGVDSAGRPFFALSVVTHVEGMDSHRVCVVHRRYRKGAVWVAAGARLPGIAGAFDDESVVQLQKLVDGGVIECKGEGLKVSLG